MTLENLSVQPETPTAVRVDLGAIFVSLELSKSTWLVTSLTPGSDKMSRHSIVGGDIAGLFTVIADLRNKAQARLGVKRLPKLTLDRRPILALTHFC
jgi:transposase